MSRKKVYKPIQQFSRGHRLEHDGFTDDGRIIGSVFIYVRRKRSTDERKAGSKCGARKKVGQGDAKGKKGFPREALLKWYQGIAPVVDKINGREDADFYLHYLLKRVRGAVNTRYSPRMNTIKANDPGRHSQIVRRVEDELDALVGERRSGSLFAIADSLPAPVSVVSEEEHPADKVSIYRRNQEKAIERALVKVKVHPAAADVLAAALFDQGVRQVRVRRKRARTPS